MADEPATTSGDAESANIPRMTAQNELVYESNPKHSDPWQIGKKGSLCEPEIRPLAADLLRESVSGKESATLYRKAEPIVRRNIRRIDGTDTQSAGKRFRRSCPPMDSGWKSEESRSQEILGGPLMARQREIMVGSRDRFAVKIAFQTDPDRGLAATREHSISWGAIEVWANGHNLCRHLELGESVDAVHWYLLPILRWLASNWDFLLHEERLPGRNAARDAWISMQRTAEPPPALPDDAAEHWEIGWHNWWQRHALQAAREGGLIPNLFVRRWRDLIELSWGDSPIAGIPEGFTFGPSMAVPLCTW